MSPASVTLWWGKFTDGASAWSTWLISVVPCCCICSDVNTSTGTASSSEAACRAREPTTTSTGASPIGCVCSAKSWRAGCASLTVTRTICGT